MWDYLAERKKDNEEKEGDSETVTGVSAQTGMCAHCQPRVTEENKHESRIPSPAVSVSVV